MPKMNFTPAHKFFLRYFIHPSSIDDVVKRNPNLGSSLGEDPKTIFEKFVTDGLLKSASLQEKLSTLTISDLKLILRKLGLSEEGKKDELIFRILSVESTDIAANVANIKLFICSDKGRNIIDDQAENTQGKSRPLNGIKRTATWLDDKGVTGNVIYDVLKLIVGAIIMWLVNNKLILGNWLKRLWGGIKESARNFLSFIYELGRRIRK